jgi:DNA-binding XRE family transcriptional regulator
MGFWMNDRFNPIDSHVGACIAHARRQRGLSQERLAFALGVSLGVLQAYEAGFTRIGADALYSICRLFDLRPGSFFEAVRHRAPILSCVTEVDARPRMLASGAGFAPLPAHVGAVPGVVKSADTLGGGQAAAREQRGIAAANDSKDRRAAERRSFRVEVAVQRGERRLIAMVDDISLTGIRLADRFGLAAGEALRIELGGDWITGRVVWAAKGRAGLEFEQPLKRLPIAA